MHLEGWLMLWLYLEKGLQGKAWELQTSEPNIIGGQGIGGNSERHHLHALVKART